jgi:DNA-binding XRE family transcriptional regulator
MVAATHAGKAARQLNPAQIKALKALARHVDAEEGAAIKARGRAVFQRHAAIRQIVKTLKTRRMEMGVSLSELAERTGMAKPNLSRLENNERFSPTLETLHRYAQALGMMVRVELVARN